ncbi:ABC transporter permease [Caldicellulosiruptoraceae bacterium PP1]
MIVPFVLYEILFRYVPIFGWVMAFKDYQPFKGIIASDWVGLNNFKMLFQDSEFWYALRNTIGISFLKLITTFLAAIIFALMLNEVKNMLFKRTIQTVSYLPHFVSWVVAASIVMTVLSPESGILNQVLFKLHIIKEPIVWMGETKYFWWILALSQVWKETGWNAIVYLAAMTSIDPELYDAASVDGASRLQKIRHITLPSIAPTISMLLILNVGWLLNAGFEQVLLLRNSMVEDVAQILDTYVLDYGISMYRYSYATAAGIFKSVISVILVLAANKIAQKLNASTVV